MILAKLHSSKDDYLSKSNSTLYALVKRGSYTTFVISICGIRASSVIDSSVKLRRNFALEKKYAFTMKEMYIISKVLVKFHGTLDITELSTGIWSVHKS